MDNLEYVAGQKKTKVRSVTCLLIAQKVFVYSLGLKTILINYSIHIRSIAPFVAAKNDNVIVIVGPLHSHSFIQEHRAPTVERDNIGRAGTFSGKNYQVVFQQRDISHQWVADDDRCDLQR